MGFFEKLFGRSKKQAEMEADDTMPAAEMGEPEGPTMDAPVEEPTSEPVDTGDVDVDVDMD